MLSSPSSHRRPQPRQHTLLSLLAPTPPWPSCGTPRWRWLAVKRDAEAASTSASASSPFLSSPRGDRGDNGKDDALHLPPPLHQRYPITAPVRTLLALEDPRSPSAPASYRILLAVLACAALVALVSAPSVWSRLVSPRSCRSSLRLIGIPDAY